MNIRIEVELTKGSIKAAIAEVNELIEKIETAEKLLVEKLADIGVTQARIDFPKAYYLGDNTVDLDVVSVDGGCMIVASGENVGFLEFGAGKTFGYGHPEPQGFGPGTWPEGHRQNKKYANWENPAGWHIPGGERTWGNRPSMAMYNAKEMIIKSFSEVAREVFK